MMQFLTIVVAFGVLISLLYVLARPHWAFVLVMILFPLKQLLQVYIPTIASKPGLVNIAIGVVALLAMLLRLFRGERIAVSMNNPVTVFIFGLYVLWFVGIFWSPSREFYLAALKIDAAYITLLLILLPLLVMDLVEFRRMLYGMMFVGATIAILVMANPRSTYQSGRLVLDLGMVGSVKDAGNPLAVASLGAVTALIAVFIRPARNSFLMTAFRVGAFVAGFGVAIGSGSRGQVLAASIVGIIFFPVSRRLANPKQFFVVAASFLMLVGGLFVVFKLFIGEQNVQRWDPFQMLKDTTGRLEMAFLLFEHYVASPAHWMFGLGTGFYSSISREAMDRDYVHNIAAEVLCEHGIVGAALFTLAGIFLVRYSLRLWAIHRDDPPNRAASALISAICVFSLLEALKQGSMTHPAPFYWWLVFAKLATAEFRKHDTILAEEAEYASDEEWGDGSEFADDPDYGTPEAEPNLAVK